MEGIASAIQAGRLSFAFLEAAPFRRWAVRSTRTYRQVSQGTGVPLLQLGLSSGTFDLAWLTRLLATAWTEAYLARFEGPACWGGQTGSRRCRSLTCWSTGPRVSTGRAREVAGRRDDDPPGTGRGGGRPGRRLLRPPVNLAARIAAHAGAGQVLVSGSVAESAPPQGVRFVEQGELPHKGFAHPVRLLEACRA